MQTSANQCWPVHSTHGACADGSRIGIQNLPMFTIEWNVASPVLLRQWEVNHDHLARPQEGAVTYELYVLDVTEKCWVDQIVKALKTPAMFWMVIFFFCEITFCLISASTVSTVQIFYSEKPAHCAPHMMAIALYNLATIYLRQTSRCSLQQWDLSNLSSSTSHGAQRYPNSIFLISWQDKHQQPLRNLSRTWAGCPSLTSMMSQLRLNISGLKLPDFRLCCFSSWRFQCWSEVLV